MIVFSDEPGLPLLPPVRRTRAPADQTPTLQMRMGQRPKVSVVGWCCYSLGQPARYFYRVVPGSVTDRILIRQLHQVHRSLGRPIVLIWDNLGARTLGELLTTARRGLRHIQRHPALVTGFLAAIHLDWNPQPSTS
ncbi:hypothetical protein ACFXO2_15220 [Streptomyces sp. NPDC059152]|uniref:hypothetical protein n=1 Tax=Streptomyces sp. NPDC059152 TaxID=3346742 RepID=UPI003675E0F2